MAAFVLEDVFRESVKTVNTMLEEKHISILFETSVSRTDAVPLGYSLLNHNLIHIPIHHLYDHHHHLRQSLLLSNFVLSSLPFPYILYLIPTEEGEIILMGDQLRLESALINFLTHAAKVSPVHSQITVLIKMKLSKATISGKAESIASNPSLPSSPLLDNSRPAVARSLSGIGLPGGGAGSSGKAKVTVLLCKPSHKAKHTHSQSTPFIHLHYHFRVLLHHRLEGWDKEFEKRDMHRKVNHTTSLFIIPTHSTSSIDIII